MTYIYRWISHTSSLYELARNHVCSKSLSAPETVWRAHESQRAAPIRKTASAYHFGEANWNQHALHRRHRRSSWAKIRVFRTRIYAKYSALISHLRGAASNVLCAMHVVQVSDDSDAGKNFDQARFWRRWRIIPNKVPSSSASAQNTRESILLIGPFGIFAKKHLEKSSASGDGGEYMGEGQNRRTQNGNELLTWSAAGSLLLFRRYMLAGVRTHLSVTRREYFRWIGIIKTTVSQNQCRRRISTIAADLKASF